MYQGSLGFEAIGFGILEFVLISILIAYIPLSITYVVTQIIRRRDISTKGVIGLAVLSVLLGFLMLGVPSISDFVDSVFLSDWWYIVPLFR